MPWPRRSRRAWPTRSSAATRVASPPPTGRRCPRRRPPPTSWPWSTASASGTFPSTARCGPGSTPPTDCSTSGCSAPIGSRWPTCSRCSTTSACAPPRAPLRPAARGLAAPVDPRLRPGRRAAWAAPASPTSRFARFEEAFTQVWLGHAESDGFNRLVLAAGLEWRDVTVLRAYGRYLLQIKHAFGQTYMERTLAGHPDIARRLVALFHLRFRPDGTDPAEREATRAGWRARSPPPSTRWPAWTRTGCCGTTCTSSRPPCAPTSSRSPTGAPRTAWPSSSTRRGSRSCRSPGPPPRSSSTPPGSKGCTCGVGRWPGAGSVGPTATTTSAPRCWGS